jgi:uncharacterized protein YjbJ (UPF0337 family)
LLSYETFGHLASEARLENPKRWKMNKDRVDGKIDEIVGTLKRKTGEWTGDTPLQVEGIAQQVKGNLKNALGIGKDLARNVSANIDVRIETGLDDPATDIKRPNNV